MGGRVWTNTEKSVIRDFYFDALMDRLLEMLPGRTIDAIHNRAKIMRVSRSKKFGQTTQFKPTHGMSNQKIKAYDIWCSMRRRCFDSKHKSYQDYGGRGIMPCKEWSDFEVFYLDMGDPPEGLTLGRKDNGLGYSKDNCRWETMIEQNNNRRSNRFIEAFGERLTVKQWARKVGIKVSTIDKRIDKHGWSFEDALSKPVRVTASYVHWTSGKPINEDAA